MQIRSATTTDIPKMVTLERHAATASHWSVAQYEAIFSENLPRRLALIVEEDRVVQGFLVARELDREWELENIVVAVATRRRGCGTEILRGFLQQAREHGARAISLEVRESNVAARSLYEKCAFCATGKRRRYYQNPSEDAVIYRLDFQ